MADKDKRSAEFQRLSWEALRKGINGLVNKVNVGNIRSIVPELLELNLVRGRGLLCRALMKAQLASPGFTHIYAALVAVLPVTLTIFLALWLRWLLCLSLMHVSAPARRRGGAVAGWGVL